MPALTRLKESKPICNLPSLTIALLALVAFIFTACGGGSGNNNNSNNGGGGGETSYSVSFVTNGGSSVNARRVEQGDNISTAPATTRAGYAFDGWFTDNNTFLNQVSFPYTPTEYITLYAKWTQVAGTYTVRFETDGGSYVATLDNVTTISTEPHTSKQGFDFDGWFTTSNFSGGRIEFPYTVIENITLYAKWTQVAETFTVTFNSNGGSTVTPVQVNDTASAPKRPTRNCDIFDGWYFDNNTFTYQVTFPYTVTGDITLYAKWRQETEAACIGTAEFDDIRNNLAGNYRLSADISLEAYDNWLPIGTESAPFTGIIDGNGYKITGLTINGGTESYVGLFGYVSGSTITNLAIEDVDIAEGIVSGAIAGAVYNNSTITGCYSTGNISVSATGYYSVSGGIVGDVFDSTITDCYSAVNISAGSNSSIIGGIAGRVNSNSTITNCYNEGSISSSSSSYNDSNHGGIAGLVSNSTITGCHSTGNISAKRVSGGIAGYISNSTITDCYSTGNISASNPSSAPYSGGIVGRVDGNSTITDCYSTGNISTSNISLGNSYTGGIAGRVMNSGNTITNCYSTGNISSTTSTPSSGGIVGSIEDRGTIIGCHSTGNISSYEFSGGIAGEVRNSTITGCYSTGEITAQYGGSAGGIAGYVTYNSSGYGSTISDCYSTGTIGGTSRYSGGIVGYIAGSTITGCHSTGNISTDYTYIKSLIIINPPVTYTDSSSGGIAGYSRDSIITNTYSTGSISSHIGSSEAINFYSYAGGIVGYSGVTASGVSQVGTIITDCYSSGDIESSVSANSGTYSYAGGISGNRGSLSKPTNCVAINDRIVAHTSAFRIGGEGSNNFALNTMTAGGNAQFDTTDTTAHGVSKTDAQLKTQSTYSNTVNGDGLGGLGWDFDGDLDNDPVWKMPNGGGYPILYWQ